MSLQSVNFRSAENGSFETEPPVAILNIILHT